MRSDLDLLVSRISNLNLRAYQQGQEAGRLARDIGELQAIAIAVAGEAEIATQACPDHLSHPAHLWRDHVLNKHPVVHRCEGRST